MGDWWRENLTWQNAMRVAACVIVAVQLRQVLIGGPLDQPLTLLAAGLFGVGQLFRRNGNGRNGDSKKAQ